MKTTAPTPMPRLALLIKSAGDFKHSGKYYLLNGRWHALHADKTPPKGAPVAAHPTAAGVHIPAKHLSDSEWAQLKLPAENVNAGSFNKQIDKLQELAESGHVTGILGMQFGTNTYGKKAAIIANHILGLYGSDHKVVPGQKAGEHAAVSQAPVDAPAAEKPVRAVDPMGSFASLKGDIDEAVEQGKKQTLSDIKAYLTSPQNKSQPGAKEALAYLNSKAGDAGDKPKLGPVGQALKEATKDSEKPEGPTAKESLSVAETASEAPAYGKGDKFKFSTGLAKVNSGTWEIYNTSGDLLHMKKVGAKVPNSSNTVNIPKDTLDQALAAGTAAKVGNDGALESKLKTTDDYLPSKKSDPVPASAGLTMPTFVEGKTTQGVVDYYVKQAQKILDLAAAGDAEGLEKLKAEGLKPNSKGKVGNTYKGKTENSKMLLALHEQALQQATPSGMDVSQTAEKPNTSPEHAQEAPVSHPVPATQAVPESKPDSGTAPSKVSQIPWDQQLLPDSNSNSASHNKQVAKIKAMAEAGDLAGLEAFKAGKNTYGTKQNKLAALAIAALNGDAAAPAPAVAPADAGKTDSTPPENTATPAAEGGPQEGDTKEGADGTLVFHGGRWHKQEQPEPAEQHPLDAVPMPELNFSTASNNPKVLAALEKLKEQVKAEGPSALNGATKHMKVKGEYIVTLPGQYGNMKIYGYEHAPAHPGTKVYEYIEALKAAVGKPKKTPKPKVTEQVTASVTGPDAVPSMDNWVQTGPQGGSNPGGKFKDEHGVEWYCKFPADEDVAKSEVLAAKLYAAAGIVGQDAKLVTKGGKVGIASRWATVSKAPPAVLAKTPGVLAGFATDAWLGNWDVVGMGFDNLQVGADGKAVRVDAGGSLTYRAQGGKKSFGTSVVEIDSLRDKAINPQAATVFGKMTQADITGSVTKVAALSEYAIRDIVEKHGPGDAANRKALADVLVARRADLLAKYPKAAKPPKKRLDPTNLPVDADRLPKAHDFNNWLGAGKPLSSQPHVNAANMAVEQEMLAMAKTGNLTKLKDFQFHAIDKATGNATGQMIPIAQHPSKHVVQLHADLVQMLDELANPPEPLKVFHETDVSTVEALAASLPPKKFGTTVNAVHSNEKLGFWVVLGTAHGAQKFKPSKVMDYTKSAIDAGFAKFKQASHLARHFIHSVQASGSYNDLFRMGKETDHQGNSLASVAKAALEHATTMPAGTSIYRWQNMPDDMVKKIMGAPEGTVFQATGPMCTSYSATGTSGFGQHRVTIRYAEGAKAVDSFGSGKFSGEKEVTTLPNSRFVILSKQMVPNEKNPGKQRLELEVLMLPPDLGL